MAIGPLETFVFPGVYTRTLTEASGISAAGDIRFPGIAGTGLEEMRISDFEMIRGSSAVNDNLILEEDASSKFDGTNSTFTVDNYPIVNGDGTGTVATHPRNVIVLVNGEAVAVNSVNGLIGEVQLVQIPRATDTVRVNYYYKRRDTYIENEDISDQADGLNREFKVRSLRITTGDNSGSSATDNNIGQRVTILYNPDPAVPGDEFERTVLVIEVKVNGTAVTISSLDGSDAQFLLASAPAAGATVTVTYFTNTWQDTYDILPAAEVNRLVKVGLSQDTSDYSIGDDCVLSGSNHIHWGHSVEQQQGIYTAGSTALNDNVVTSLTDTRTYGRIAAPFVPATDSSGTVLTDSDGNAINNQGNTIFTLPSDPVKGTGTAQSTEDPDDIIAYVGSDWDTAYTNGPQTVLSMDGRRITLSYSPSQASEDKVYVTYYENILVDDTWTLTNEVAGGTGVGRYSITSRLNGTALDTQNDGTGTVLPVYAGTGAVNIQVNPLYSLVEKVTFTFDGVGGFTVTSSVANGTGTGTVNTGYQGRTYIDSVTQFRVTFANTDTWTPTVGQTVIYKVGEPDEASALQTWFYAKASTVRAIPGVNLTVATTAGGSYDNTDDTVIIDTYNKSGNEPSVGDSYYVTFDKAKTDYSIKFYTDMPSVYRDYGPLDIQNRVVVAANLAFINGARAVAIKQILKAANGGDASVQSYIDGIDEFNEPLQNGLRPTLIQPLSTSSVVHQYLKSSNAIQCSIKYKNERTSVVGFAFGTEPESAIQQCKALKTEKLTPIYPEAAVIPIADSFGNEVEYLVDGSMVSCAVAGQDVSPARDIATPMTNVGIVGFNRLYRRLDEVTAALVTNAGCTVLEERRPVIRIKMYLTSDLSNALTRDPRIVEIKHFVQQGLRTNLDQFIGQKNLPSIIPQITRVVEAYFRGLKNSSLIVDFTGVKVKQNAYEPSTVDVEAYYSPVFPLNWIIVTLNLRQSL